MEAKTVPIYECEIKGEMDGISCISFVSSPAVEVEWLQFAKGGSPLPLVKLSQDGRHIIGVLLRAEYPIYRVGDDGSPYYVRFSRECIKAIAAKLQQSAKIESLQHNGERVEGLRLESLFIKDMARGIDPVGFEGVADGSLFAVYEVDNEEVRAMIARGELRGFSIEGLFNLTLTKFNNMKLRELLMKFLDEKKAIKISDGLTIVEQGGGDIVEGVDVVYVEKEEQVADGEYQWGDNVVTIKDGKVATIADKSENAEPAAVEEVSKADFDALVARVEIIEKIINAPEGDKENFSLSKKIKTIWQ